MPAPGLDRLRNIPLFAQLDDEALRLVAELATEFSAPAGHVLAERDHAGTGLFILEEGRVGVDLPDGSEIELGRGEVFGELSLLTDRQRRTARVHALTDVTCLAIARDDFSRLLEAQPRIALALLPVLAGRLADRIA